MASTKHARVDSPSQISPTPSLVCQAYACIIQADFRDLQDLLPILLNNSSDGTLTLFLEAARRRRAVVTIGSNFQQLSKRLLNLIMPFVDLADLSRCEAVCRCWRAGMRHDAGGWRAYFSAALKCATSRNARHLADHMAMKRISTSSLRSLTELDVSWLPKAHALKLVQQLPNLRRMIIAAPLYAAPFQDMRELENLESLELSTPDAIPLPSFLSSLNLTTLLVDCLSPVVSRQDFLEISRLSSLTELSLYVHLIPGTSVAGFYLPRLRKLDFVTENSSATLSSLRLPADSLQELKIMSLNPLDGVFIADLASACSSLVNLSKLELGFRTQQPLSGSSFAHLPLLRSLKIDYFDGKFEFLSSLPLLEELQLKSFQLPSPRSDQYFAPFRHLRRLQTLHLVARGELLQAELESICMARELQSVALDVVDCWDSVKAVELMLWRLHHLKRVRIPHPNHGPDSRSMFDVIRERHKLASFELGKCGLPCCNGGRFA